MKTAVVFLTLLLHTPFSAFAQTCASAMPYANMQYLTSAQLSRYKLTDPCSITCQSGYYGEFCEPNTKYAEIPQGPWNSKGYYSVGDGILKSMTLDVSGLAQISYTSSDSTLVGIYRQQLINSALVLVSLNSRTTRTVLAAPAGGYLDALQVRYGRIFVARSMTAAGPYDVSILTGDLQTGPYSTALFMPTTSRASMIEVFQDKGMNTTFIYTTSNNVMACTPDQVCRQWYSGAGVTGMVCGIDCPTSLYISKSNTILKLTDNGVSISSSVLATHPTNINCLASVPALNTLLYRVDTTVRQLSSTQSKTSTYNALLTLSAPTISVCSLDVSESNTQIILVENGVINTLETLQQPCDYQSTSPAVASTSQSACVACPPPPANAYLVVGSPTCQWQCYQGYTRLVSQCVSDLPLPCPARYSAVDGVCTPSEMPWAPPGQYVSGVLDSPIKPMTTGISSVFTPIKAAAGGGLSFLSTGQSLYVSGTYGASWQTLTPVLSTSPISQCGYNTNNQYTLLGYQDTVLFVGFTLRGITPTQHCMWALNASTLVGTRSLSVKPTLVQYWSLGAQPCSVALGSAWAVYFLFCNTHYILQSSLGGERLTVLAGQTRSGYVDGDAQSSWFNTPSSLAFHNQRLYVADTGNCVIREIDVVRNTTGVAAGAVGVCQRQDGTDSGLRGPTLLTPTMYEGFFLFLDQGSDEAYPTLRQFHAPTGHVQTVRTSSLAKVSKLLSFSDRIQLANGEDANFIYDIQVVPSNCPAGTMSREGGAFADTECLACGSGFYSSGGACVSCSQPACTAAGQMLVTCAGNNDSYCGQCTNKPSGQFSNYTGHASSYGSGSDCPWVYLPPCPLAMYSAAVSGVFAANKTATVCVNCPPWSTTSASGRTSVRQCSCLGGGVLGADNTCSIPSPFTVMPFVCPPLTSCSSPTYGNFPFPIQALCSSSIMDTPLGVCRCQPGEYISQIYPKQCDACPAHLYSPMGESCVRCPPYGEPSLDRSACRCLAGTQDMNLADDAIECVCGEGRGFNSRDGCYSCAANQYSADFLTLGPTPWAQTKECLACEPGTWADPGAGQCSPCPAGTYLDATVQRCAQCPAGQYATNPATSESCTDCAIACGGRKQTQCPTDASRFVCVDCPPTRANAVPNGLDNCATSCVEGFFEMDGECVGCAGFNATTCPAGNILVPCGVYSDAACVSCTNASMPLYYARWVGGGDQPSMSCAWECIEGYTAKSSAWVGDGVDIWICAKASAWSMFDLFTV